MLADFADDAAAFTANQLNDDGGFKNRAGKSDLYYTLFGIESLLALNAQVPQLRIESYLNSFTLPASLDLVHLAALIRCRADLKLPIPPEIIDLLHRFAGRCASVYDCFLLLASYQDANLRVENEQAILDYLAGLQSRDGSYANSKMVWIGSTPATAGAIVILNQLNQSIPQRSVDWLLGCMAKEGGFLAVPSAFIPDLLSTATALQALATAGAALDDIRKPCTDFVLNRRTETDGFCGSSFDTIPDCEYTFYALLSLGHLAQSA